MVDRDRAAGIRLGAWLVACGLILGRGVAGDWVSASGTVLDLMRALPGIVGILLLAVIVELLARPTPRSREMAIRAAIGGGRRRLVQQALTESILLSCIGGALGIALVYWSLEPLLGILPPRVPLAGFGNVAIDRSVLTFSLLLSIVTGVLFGVAPALHGSMQNLRDQLVASSAGTPPRARR
jgi:hypothetical protein